MLVEDVEQFTRAVASRPKLAWQVAELLPEQGQWTETQYLWVTDQTSRLVELSDGAIEVLPMPGPPHQKIVALLYRLLFAFVQARSLGTVLFAPLRVRLWPGTFREPDIVFLHADHADRETPEFWNGADLVIEVVSPSKPEHDLVTKRQEYALAGIPEYWIVNPEAQTIAVLSLAGLLYIEHGLFRRSEVASSALLEGFAVAVDEVLDAH